MALYWINDISLGVKYQVDSYEYIIRSAHKAGYDYPISDGIGASLASLAYIYSGEVDNSDQTFLDEWERRAGFFLLDTAYPDSDLTISTNPVSVLKMYEDFNANRLTWQKPVHF